MIRVYMFILFRILRAPLLQIPKEKKLDLIGFLINRAGKHFRACANSQSKMKEDDLAIANAHNPNMLEGALALLEKVRKHSLTVCRTKTATNVEKSAYPSNILNFLPHIYLETDSELTFKFPHGLSRTFLLPVASLSSCE